MKYAFIALLFLFSIQSHAQYPRVNKNIFNKDVKLSQDPNKVILEGKSCAELEIEIAAIKTWSIRIGEKPGDSSCQCSNKVCKIDITNIVPYLVKEKQGSCPAFDGPNCWNGALVATKMLPNLRYTSDTEMAFWMSSPLCKERAANEKALPGDIIAIREKNGDEVHGFIHLTENLSFSKNGYRKGAPYSLQSPENVYTVYRVKKECQGVNGKPAKGCSLWSNIFACESITEYLKKHPIQDKVALSTWEALETEDCSVSTQAFEPVMNKDVMMLAKASLAVVISLAEKNIVEAKTEEDRFIWRAIEVKAKANLDQTTKFK